MLLQTTSAKIIDNEKQCDFEFRQDLRGGSFRDAGTALHAFFSLLSRSLELCWKCFLFLCTSSSLESFSSSSGEWSILQGLEIYYAEMKIPKILIRRVLI